MGGETGGEGCVCAAAERAERAAVAAEARAVEAARVAEVARVEAEVTRVEVAARARAEAAAVAQPRVVTNAGATEAKTMQAAPMAASLLAEPPPVPSDLDDNDDPSLAALRLRATRLRAALSRVRVDATAAGADSALATETLRGIVQRAARASDPRHLTIRKDNILFFSRTGGSAAAVDFLTGAGFVADADGAWLKVVDRAALWLAKEITEESSAP